MNKLFTQYWDEQKNSRTPTRDEFRQMMQNVTNDAPQRSTVQRTDIPWGRMSWWSLVAIPVVCVGIFIGINGGKFSVVSPQKIPNTSNSSTITLTQLSVDQLVDSIIGDTMDEQVILDEEISTEEIIDTNEDILDSFIS